MKLVVDRDAAMKAMARVVNATQRKGTIPILQNVRLTATRKVGLAISATDLDVQVTELVPARVERDGEVTVPAALLHDIVRNLPAGAEAQLEFGGADPRLGLTCGRARFKAPTLPVQDFPDLKMDREAVRFTLPAKELHRLLSIPRAAQSSEEVRYFLIGEFFHVVREQDGLVLRTVATDGHRLFLAEQPAPDGADEPVGVIIPKRTVELILALIGGTTVDVEVSCGASMIGLRFAQIELVSKRLDGAYPDYSRVLPKEIASTITVDRDILEGAVKRVAVACSDQARATKFSVEDGKLLIGTRSAECGEASEEIEVDYAGAAFEVGFSSRYVLDVLSSITGETVSIGVSTPVAPTLWQDSADPARRFVLMPLRV